jgi:hypothetical protein
MSRALRPVLVVLLCLTLSQAAAAQDAWLASGMPLPIKVWGFVGPPPEGMQPADSWVVQIKDEKYKFQVKKLDVLNGATLAMSIYDALDPYPVSLTFLGEGLETIINTPPGEEIAIIGNLQFGGGARQFIISSVTPVTAPTAGPTP